MTTNGVHEMNFNCTTCGKGQMEAVTLPEYVTTIKYGGRKHAVRITDVPVSKCTDCGDILLSDGQFTRLYAQLRSNLGLLQPSQIVEHRNARNMQQKDLANRVGCSPEYLSRIENGAFIQSRELDGKLREEFGLRVNARGMISAGFTVLAWEQWLPTDSATPTEIVRRVKREPAIAAKTSCSSAAANTQFALAA